MTVNPSLAPFNELPVQRLESHATLPTRAHPGDAGLDLYALDHFVLEPGQGTLARTGIAVEIQEGYVGMIADRSSMARRGLKTAGGIIDAGYRGEVKIVLWNWSQEVQKIQAGERLAQMLLLPIATPAVSAVSALGGSTRGEGGFGSTGR